VAITAAALLVGVAVAGCNRGSTPTPGAEPGSTDTATVAGPSPTLAPIAESAGDAASATASESGTQSPGASIAGPGGSATPDPVASELDAIQQLIDDINNSLSSSDSSEQGGE
jgi:hypothetical protein